MSKTPWWKPKWSKRLFIFLGISVLLILADLLTKWAVELNTVEGQPITVIPNFFYITKSYNTAIAFSLGSNWGVGGRALNIMISIVMSVAIYFYWITHDHKFRFWERLTAMLLAAGAVGNLIDRAFYWEATTGFNGVIDFFQFYLGGGPNSPVNFVNPFATFNFADACLTIGIVILLVILIVEMISDARKSGLSKDPRLESAPAQIPSEKSDPVEEKEAESEEKLAEEPKEETKKEETE